MNQLLKGGGELRGPLRGDQESRHSVADGFGDPADLMGHDRERMGCRLEVNEAKALDAAPVGHAGEGKDVRAVVDVGQLLVGDVPEEADGKSGIKRGLVPQELLVVALVAPSHDPILDPGAHVLGEHLERLERDQLSLARMEAAHREDDDLRLGPGGPLVDDGEVRAQGARGKECLLRRMGESLEEQLLRVGREGADPGRMPDQAPGKPAPKRAPGEVEDLRPVEREDQAPGPKRLEELEHHHGQHRPRLRQVYGGVAQLPAPGHQLAGQLDLADEVVATLERKPPDLEGPLLLHAGRCGLGPDLHVIAQVDRGLGDLLGEGGYPPTDRVELMGDEEYGGGWLCK